MFAERGLSRYAHSLRRHELRWRTLPATRGPPPADPAVSLPRDRRARSRGRGFGSSIGVGRQAAQVERLSLPFQTVETINESRATRERDAGSLLQSGAAQAAGAQPAHLGRQQARDEQPARRVRRAVKLIYIDPPFDTGADFSHPRALSAMSRSRSAFDPRRARLPRHVGLRPGSYLTMLYRADSC